jgi:hypothetical protein
VQITWLLIALLWGSLRLFGTRNNTIADDNILEENSWGFGQALATAMLGTLAFSAIETYIGQMQIVLCDNTLTYFRNQAGNDGRRCKFPNNWAGCCRFD